MTLCCVCNCADSTQATFDIKITAPPDPVVVLSNMPLSHTHGGHSEASSSSSGGLISYHFEPSPPMPTYLVAWVVGELAHVEVSCQLNGELPQSPYAAPHSHGRRRRLLHSSSASTSYSRRLQHGDDGDDDDSDEDDEGHAVDDGSRGRSIPVRVFGTTDRASQFGMAKEVACHALQTLETLLQVGSNVSAFIYVFTGALEACMSVVP